MIITSIWTITFDPGGPNQRVIVTTSNDLPQEIELQADQVTAEGRYAGAAAARPSSRKQVQREIQIGVIRTHASLDAAYAHIFEADLAVPVGISAPLRFARAGGDTYQLADAVFKSWRTTPYRPGPFKTLSTYAFTGGALSKL